MIMKKNIALITGILCAAGLTAQIMVLPLKVNTQNHSSYQWLGKAVAYYLLSGFQSLRKGNWSCGKSSVKG